jgi:hypothetical protein
VKAGRIVGVLIVAGLVALVVWVARHTYWGEVSIPTPLRNEAATNPYYAAQRFTKELGIESQRETVLTRFPVDEVLVLSSWHWTLVEARQRRLQQWVEDGGRLVADRTLIGIEDDFEAWSGISRRRGQPAGEPGHDEDDQPSGDDDVAVIPPPSSARECRVLHESARAAEGRAGAALNLELCGGDDRTHLVADAPDWAMSDDTGMQVLRVKVGKGSVTLINDSPFRYRSFLRGDHAALLVAAGQLRRGDTVHFLSEEKQASLISLMWTYGWPVVLLALALIGLALWRNSVRFGPIAADPELARRSLAEQIRGTGQFAVRFGGGKSLHAAAVRALDEAAQRRLPAYPRLSTAERIAAIAQYTGLDAATLGPAIHHSGARRVHELRQAIALIESARRRLQIEPH